MAIMPGSPRVAGNWNRRMRAGLIALFAAGNVFSIAAADILLPSAPLPSRATKAASSGSESRGRPAVPVRIQIPAIGIDLPVVSSERTMRGNVPRDYPLCDVAQYWTRYDLPGAPGTAWIYAHAQPGMFLPLLETARSTAGSGLIGMRVNVQVKDGRLLSYRIRKVKQNVPETNRRIARRQGDREQELILQTSEGPPGTATRLQVSAGLVDAGRTDEPAPKPKPRVCSQPASGTSGGNGSGRGGDGDTSPTVVESEESLDPMTLLFGTGAVLAGAILIAVYLVRRTP